MTWSQHAPKPFRTAKFALLLFLAFTMNLWAQPTVPPTPATIPASQGPVAPFDITGFIQFASVDSLCAPGTTPPSPANCKTAGGWIQINNHVIRVPQNTVLEMPAVTLTWEELFEFNSTGNTKETGMALSDSARLPGTFEVHVQGNMVNGTYIAGLVFISQQSLNSSQGFIESLDYANGIMVINGTRVQINDPLGKFSVGQSPDARFSIDEDNPTIRSETAFPMCIPRVDPAAVVPPATEDQLCPQKNRRDATGKVQMTLTMDPPGTAASATDPTPSDPTVFAPFEVGDYVTYAGTLLTDSKGSYISAHTIIGNVGIYTAAGIDPAYVAIDVLLQGVGGIANPAFPQEAAVRTRVEGFSTDPSRTVDIYAIDIDCGTGAATARTPWVSNFFVDPGPPTGAVMGRWRWRPAGGDFLPPSRSVGVRVSGGIPAVVNPVLNIMTGQYQAPNFTFIFPENLGIGTPPVPSNFGDLTFLRNGSGPWNGAANQFIGQLNPWPDATAPAVSCTAGGTPPPPSATAVAAFSPSPGPVATGTTVTLDATGSTPSNGPFAWTQTGGPAVTLTNPSSVQATFVAPSLSAQTNLTFQVSVGGANSTTPATASVTVPVAAAPVTNPPTVSATSSPANPVASASAVTLSATGVDPAGGTLTYTWAPPAGITLTPVAGTNGAQQTFTAPTVPAGTAATTFTFSVTATSSVAPNLTSSAATVNVVVNPATDTVTITNATYRINKATLTVTATDNTPGVTLTCTLNEINQATGKPWTAVMGPASPPVAGTFTATFPNISAPSQVTVTSSAGGSASSPVTTVRQ
jgi:hypothetical protein